MPGASSRPDCRARLRLPSGDALRRCLTSIAKPLTPVARPAGGLASKAHGGYRRASRAAHRIRYLPLLGAALGAILMWLGPTARPGVGDRIDDDSMAPTLAAGQLVHVNRHAFDSTAPAVGQLVAFRPPAAERCAVTPPSASACATPGSAPAEGDGIKRIVAGPGDSVELRSGHLIRNGLPVAEPYVRISCTVPALCRLPKPVRLPPGTWWLLADNRDAPNDSRTYGPIPQQWLDGLVSIPASSTTSSRRRPGG